jgi:four helix bundle protein
MASGEWQVENPKPHQRLELWQQSILLVKEVYAATARFPKEELFGLVSQMRRAATSIPSNIAEGAARNGDKEYLYFLSIARGSLSELDTPIQIAQMLEYLPKEHPLPEFADRVGRLLTGFGRKLLQDGKQA